MKKLLLAGLLLFAAHGLWADVTAIQKFGGLNTDDNALTLDGKSPDSQNVMTDVFGGLTPRFGYVTLSTETCNGGLWRFPHSSGTTYVLCANSDESELKASDDGGATFTIDVSSISATQDTVGSVLGDRFYFMNRDDGLKYWDTSSTTTVDASISGNSLVTHKGRLWASGFTAAPRTVYASAFGDGTSWDLVTDPADTDPVRFQIGNAIDEPVTGVFASFQDKLIVFKGHSFYGILGNNRSDFVVRTYSDRVGTAYLDSAKDCDNALRWLGDGRTIWEFNGSQLVKISEGIKNLMDTVAQGDANQRSLSLDSQADFETGTVNIMSTSISPGSVVLSTWTDTDTSGADFGAGTTFVNVDTSTVSGEVYLTYADTDVDNNSFETCASGPGSNWETVTGAFACDNSFAAQDGSSYLTAATFGSRKHKFVVTAPDNTLLESGTEYTNPGTTTSWGQVSYTPTGISIGQAIRIGYYEGSSLASPINVVLSDTFTYSGATFTWYQRYEALGAPTFFTVLLIDLVESGKSSIGGGSFTSQTFDTALSSPAWSTSSVTSTDNGNSLTWGTESSTDGVSWNSTATWTPGGSPTSSFDRYIRYSVVITTTSNATALPHFADVTLTARASTGSYVSQSVSMGTPSAWGSLDAIANADGGSITYAVYTDTDSTKTVTNGIPVAATWVSSETVTAGGVPTLSTNSYVFVTSSFSITKGTQTPTLQSLGLNWSEGSTLRVASAYPNQRYWLSVAVNSQTNNRILVYDRNREWQLYNGIDATTLLDYGSVVYFSNSSGSWKGETGYNDNGSAIDSYYVTQTLLPAGAHYGAIFNDLMVVADNSVDTLTPTYMVNGDTATEYTMADYVMNTQAGVQDVRFPFPFSQIQRARAISFKFSVSGSTFWRILGATLDYTPDRVYR